MSVNLDLVRSIYAAWERGDFSSAEWAHPDIEYAWVGGPERGSGRGVTEMREALRNFLAPWEDFRAEVEEYREMDRERVLVLIHHRGRGKTSGLELGQMQTNNADLFHVRRRQGDEVRRLLGPRACARRPRPCSGGGRVPLAGLIGISAGSAAPANSRQPIYTPRFCRASRRSVCKP